jgi:hypothetical protein
MVLGGTMVNQLCPEHSKTGPRALLYDHVLKQLEVLISRFGLQESAFQIIRSFELLCRESLAIPLGRRQPNFSTINEDGTPFQFSLGLGMGKPALQFLSEVGSPGLSNFERTALNWERIDSLAALFGSESALSGCRGLVDELAPSKSVDLSVDPGGAFWIGVSFLPEESPRLRIYVNSNWGSETESWSRLDTCASYFGAQSQWNSQKALLGRRMRPLGLSLTLCEGLSPAGRIYVRAYGNPLSYYEQLAQRAVSPTFAELLKRSAHFILGKDCIYPTKSVVCSFGFEDGLEPDFKCEFCGHCIFSSDAEAVSRCGEWLAPMQAHSEAYFDMLQALTKGEVSRSNTGLHSFVGLGFKRQQSYSTFYLNPGAVGSVYGESGWTYDL